EDIPQADNLQDVVRVVEAVNNGAQTFQEIAVAIGKVERQGRYYRRAAELLGFIKNTLPNSSKITVLGRRFLRADRQEGERILTRAVLNSRMIQRMVPFLELFGTHGVERDRLQTFISNVTRTVGPTMVPRRTATIVSWLREAGLIRESGERIILNRLPEHVGVIDFASDEEPLLPARHELREYEEVAGRVKNSGTSYTMLLNQVARERANKAHEDLTKLVAKRIRAAGSVPRRNKLVDLATHIQGADYLFEMKSSIEGNIHAQVRKAVSQLYEYRYLQAIPSANLILVIENAPPKQMGWLVDYLLKDRGIFIVWDGRGDDLFCPTSISKQLHFLDPIGV
ncbi:MAG: hypothetical protein AABZ44_03920, partial [Elusimicrobiota bacterium]